MLDPSCTAEPWSSLLICPSGHRGLQTFFDRSTLLLRLRERWSIPLFCARCSRHRDATGQDRLMLEQALERP